MPAQTDFNITDNSQWSFPWQFVDGTGTAIDLTGSTFQLDIRSAAGAVLVESLTSGGGITHDDLADGMITVTFPAGIPPGEYVLDLLRLESAVAVEVLWRGSVTVEAGVTEP